MNDFPIFDKRLDESAMGYDNTVTIAMFDKGDYLVQRLTNLTRPCNISFLRVGSSLVRRILPIFFLVASIRHCSMHC